MSAGSLKAAKLKGMCSPGPETMGWPNVAALAGPASAAEPATAERAAREMILRAVVFMGTGSTPAARRGAHPGVGFSHPGARGAEHRVPAEAHARRAAGPRPQEEPVMARAAHRGASAAGAHAAAAPGLPRQALGQDEPARD